MGKNYSRFRAILAIARASLLAMFRSPTSIVFSLLFPLIFIVVFGSIVDPAAKSIRIAFRSGSDSANIIYHSLTRIGLINIANYADQDKMEEDLAKGRLTAILDIRQDSFPPLQPHYRIQVLTAASSAAQSSLLLSLVNDLLFTLNKKIVPGNWSLALVETRRQPGRIYRNIDFILPGQLGFSMLMAGVFGSAFLFFSLRQSLVLKRLFASPVSKSSVIAGEMLSRLLFQVISFMIMVALGYWAFDFTLVHGFRTFLEMLLFSVFGLIVFMGIGFIISGKIENESSIAPVANTITLPQILLCGLFFSVESYPGWMQSFCNLLPLTILVDGLRKIAFEGLSLWHMPAQLAGMAIWSLAIGFLTLKAFRWE